ncbi:hypothetical protein A5821_001234 [Enterococcus sp. 7F3_DIV0205]|uniref:Lipoprotein n=1 Tax=Candidatus Enterococcus palustris TaxID=1834189 RepID=A0AAQ3Y4R3_9ENTE|nr:hypothetical protein [Enterococcus sp. 7F3_DIV0205]OTN85632.1 hypothetical protein A5821_001578 [Enterococcus sp. 7F3_DIV0205]
MKKLIALLLLVLVGCSETSLLKTQEEISFEKTKSEKVDFKFEGKKLLITNNSKDVLTVFESETKFSIEKNKKWILADRTTGLLAWSGGASSKTVYEYDLTNELSEIDSNKVKITVYYTFGSSTEGKRHEKEMIYEQ